MKKILLIEDNKEISDSIKEYLELEDFTVHQEFRGDDGLDEAIAKDYDLILLDIMLPGIDGMIVAEKIRRKKSVPIIMTTAKDSINDKLEGFAKGAMDYIVKPFDLRELQARIEAHLQGGDTTAGVIEIGDVTIDLGKRVFTVAGEDVKLTQKEYLILEMLLHNRANPVARTDIIEYLWGGDSLFEGDGKLDVYISNIRKKLSKSLIETIKGFGYKIL